MPPKAGFRTFAAMDLAEALDALPESYAVALRLDAAGADSAVIAAGLGVEEVSVIPLLEVARQKLAYVLASDAEERL
jgi:DNA-directed RNA polymerase specialized sigma24 family protein